MAGEGKSISDADQAFIARMNKAIEDGSKSISDADQVRYLRLTGKNWPGGGRTISDRDTGGKTTSDRDAGKKTKFHKNGLPLPVPKGVNKEIDMLLNPKVFKKGGSVKKYAKGGGVRKARYK